MEDFNTGFTKNSYFNIIKSIVEGIYGRDFDLKKFEFYFCDDNRVNAYAEFDEKGGYDILKINTGTIFEVMALIKTAFAQKDILCNFGNSNEEKNGKYIGQHVFRNNKHELIFNTQNAIVDPCREELSFLVSLVAIRFVFAHEVGHIINGHTRLMHDMYLNSKIYMRMEKSNNVAQYCLDRRTLEMDADATAATNTIDHLLMLYEQKKEMLNNLQILGIEDLFELWGFAVACVFLLFEFKGKTSYDLNSFYLPNDARYLLAKGAAEQTLLSYIRNKVISYTVDVKKYDSAVTKGLIEAEKLFRLYGEDLTLTKSILNNREKFLEFSKAVNDNWEKNLLLRLKQYSRTVLFSEEETEQAIKDMKKKEEDKISLKKLIYKIFKSVRKNN